LRFAHAQRHWRYRAQVIRLNRHAVVGGGVGARGFKQRDFSPQ
jgi:hypothetical protein